MPRSLGMGRKPSKVVELTQEFIDNIARTPNVIVYYDRDDIRLCVYRAPVTGNIIFRYALTVPESRHLRSHGMKKASTPYVMVEGARTLADAQRWIAERWSPMEQALQDMPVFKKKGREPSEPEDILKDRPPEEQAHYEILMGVLMDAYAQAANGKGAERHSGGDVSFDKQDMMQIMDRVGTSYAYGQAIKKIVESQRLPKANARDELLGAIVYLAGAVAWKDRG